MQVHTPKVILIVEDEKPLVKVMSNKLKDAGYDVTASYNGEEALTLLEENKFDLIILDLVMPKMNGFTFLERMAALGVKAPVLVISNLNQEEDMNKARAYGVAGYYVKSNISLDEIVDRVKELVD